MKSCWYIISLLIEKSVNNTPVLIKLNTGWIKTKIIIVEKIDLINFEQELFGNNIEIIVVRITTPTIWIDHSFIYIKAFAENGKFVCAICAAPSLLGKRGYLNGKKAVCYPEKEFEQHLANAEIANTRVTRDGQFITAIGAGASIEFGLELVTALKDKETAEKIKNGIK